MRIVIDPGHGGSDRNNIGQQGYVEADGVLSISLYLKYILEKRYKNVQVTLTRDTDRYMSLSDRGLLAYGADLFISQHTNAFNKATRGTEVFYSVDLPEDETLAEMISKKISEYYLVPDRGAKVKESTNEAGEDYFTVIDTAQDVGCPHVLLVESLFHDNIDDENILLNQSELRQIANLQALCIERYFGLEYSVKAPEWGEEAWNKAIYDGVVDGIDFNRPLTDGRLMVILDRLNLL